MKSATEIVLNNGHKVYTTEYPDKVMAKINATHKLAPFMEVESPAVPAGQMIRIRASEVAVVAHT